MATAFRLRTRTVGQDFSRKGSVCFRTAKQFTKCGAHFAKEDKHTDKKNRPDLKKKCLVVFPCQRCPRGSAPPQFSIMSFFPSVVFSRKLLTAIALRWSFRKVLKYVHNYR